MSPWLLKVFMDGVIKEIQGRAVNVGITMMNKGETWKVPLILFIDEAVLLRENE